MTEQVSSIVRDIRDKFHGLHQLLVVERTRNASLETELKQARILISTNEEKLFLLEEKRRQLELEVAQLNEQLEDQKSAAVSGKDEEIDELVREIDHCIRQLKQ